MPVTTISVEEMRRLLERGERLFLVDVRTPAEFAGVRAAGARSMPLDGLDAAAVEALRGSPQEPLYLICQSGARAAKAWERLNEGGVGQIYCVEGGTAAWQGAGLPVERGGGNVISLERQVRIGAGSMVLLGTVSAWLVHPLFLVVPGFIGAGLVFAGITDFCGMGLMLARMPWNRRGATRQTGCAAAR